LSVCATHDRHRGSNHHQLLHEYSFVVSLFVATGRLQTIAGDSKNGVTLAQSQPCCQRAKGKIFAEASGHPPEPRWVRKKERGLFIKSVRVKQAGSVRPIFEA
jgi:hypothetical protein